MSTHRKGRRRGKAPSKRAMRSRAGAWQLSVFRRVASWLHVARVAQEVGEQWAAIDWDYYRPPNTFFPMRCSFVEVRE